MSSFQVQGQLPLHLQIRNTLIESKKLYEERKDDFKYFKENKDGSVCAKIPLKWIKINAGSKTGREMTEEQKEAARIRLANVRKKMSKK